MPSRDDEIRRLQRLRQEQLDARDPTAKQHQRNARLSQNYRRTQSRVTVGSIIKDFPYKWLWMAVGFLLGLAVALIVATVAMGEPWVKYVSWGSVAFFTVAGRVMGSIRDWGNEGWRSKR